MKIKKSLIFLTIILAGICLFIFFKQSKCSNN